MPYTLSAVLNEIGGRLDVETLAVADPAPGQVMVRIRACGCCHTDEWLRTGRFPGPLPCVLGHEMAGVVEAIGVGVGRFKVGATVIGNGVPSCGSCGACLRGYADYCEQFAMSGATHFMRGSEAIPALLGLGGFSQLTTVDQRSLVPVDTELPFEQLALLGCAAVTGMGAVFNVAKVRPGETVAVVGCGGVGQAMIEAARLAGAGLIFAVDVSDEKLLAARSGGATHTLNPTTCDAVEEIKALTGGLGADAVLEATGVTAAIMMGWQMTKRGGVFAPAGVGGSEPLIFNPNDLVTSGRRWYPVIYSGRNAASEIRRIIALLESGRFSMQRWVSQTLPLSRVNEALNAVGTGAILRSVIVF